MNPVPPTMPSGSSPQKAQQFYHYLNGHQQTQYSPSTWHVRWVDLAWMWAGAQLGSIKLSAKSERLMNVAMGLAIVAACAAAFV